MKYAHGQLLGLLAAAGVVGAAHSQVHVTRSGSFSPTGSLAEPFDTIKAGLCTAPASTDVLVEAGQYRETGRFDNAGRVIASGGRVVIGRSAAATVPVRVVSYNAHLFGLELWLPSGEKRTSGRQGSPAIHIGREKICGGS